MGHEYDNTLAHLIIEEGDKGRCRMPAVLYCMVMTFLGIFVILNFIMSTITVHRAGEFEDQVDKVERVLMEMVGLLTVINENTQSPPVVTRNVRDTATVRTLFDIKKPPLNRKNERAIIPRQAFSIVPDTKDITGGIAQMLNSYHQDYQHRVFCFEEDDHIPVFNFSSDLDNPEYFGNVTMACTMKHIAKQMDIIVWHLGNT